MFVLNNVPLSAYSTMRLGGPAKHLADITSRAEIIEAVEWAKARELPIIMIGEGSNVIWSDEGFPGLVLVNKIMGIQEYEEDDENIYLTVGSGETWDEVVAKTVAKNWSGLELLSLIPGTAGATPIQNVGAYGRETSDVLTLIEAYDTKEQKFINIPASDCEFGYRTSRFKTHDRGRFLISSVTYHLTKRPPQPPFYSGLQSYLDENNISEITSQTIRDAVVSVRAAKLPDPKLVANCGSFFANPVISRDEAQLLRQNYPEAVMWNLDSGETKISAAWMIEEVGLKDYHDEQTGMSTWPKQPLVLVNESAQSTKQLLEFREKLLESVNSKFGIRLIQEPELINGS